MEFAFPHGLQMFLFSFTSNVKIYLYVCFSLSHRQCFFSCLPYFLIYCWVPFKCVPLTFLPLKRFIVIESRSKYSLRNIFVSFYSLTKRSIDLHFSFSSKTVFVFISFLTAKFVKFFNEHY